MGRDGNLLQGDKFELAGQGRSRDESDISVTRPRQDGVAASGHGLEPNFVSCAGPCASQSPGPQFDDRTREQAR